MTNTLVRQMVEQIESEYALGITLRTMSATVGRQPAYLGRLFHQETGASVRDYLTRVRLEHAAELVRAGVKIEAVALSVGYRSKKNFYQRFKRHYGTTPVRYRTGAVSRTPSALEQQTAFDLSGDGLTAASASPQHCWFKDEEPTLSVSDQVLSQLASIVRASNRALRLAVRSQEILLHHFTRLRTGVLLTNDGGRYVGANRAAVSMTGYSMTELCDLSSTDLFASAPRSETRCVWQLVVATSERPNQLPNAMVRTKAGAAVGVHLVTLKNVLWGRRQMSAMLESPEPLLTA
jgi:PAS domain S-box-containing protein